MRISDWSSDVCSSDLWKPAHLVLDPVMVAKSGDHLLERAAVNELRESLLPLASMITPNLHEAGVLLSASPVETLKEMRRKAEKLGPLLNDSGERGVFMKGGHMIRKDTIHVLPDRDRLITHPGQGNTRQ